MRKRAACLILCVLLTLTAGSAACAARAYDAPHVVRVGYFNKAGYNMQSGNGARSGYGYEMLNRIAAYANWTYEYVGYELSWADMQRMLENGEIDLLAAVQMTEERLQKFDFGSEPIGFSSTIVTVKAGSTAYTAEDIGGWSGARIGLLRGSARNAGFDAYIAEHNVKYTPVYFDTNDEMAEALARGDTIDLGVTDDMRPLTGEWLLARFDTRPTYIAVRKGNDALLKELNSALSRLFADEPQTISELSNKYYSADSGGDISFTQEEREFIASMSGTELTAAVSPDRMPFSWFENGEATGILSDIAGLALKRSGLNVRIIETGSCEEYYELVSSRRADIVLDAWHDISSAEGRGYKLTDAYITASIARLYLKDRGAEARTLALVRRSELDEQYGRKLAESFELTYYDSVSDAVRAVYDGERDAAYLHFHTAEQAAYNDDTNRLTTDKLYGDSTQFSFAVRADYNVLLLSVLNKCVRGIAKSDKDSIVEGYVSYPERPFSIVRYVFSRLVTVIVITAAVLLLLFLVFYAITLGNRRRREHELMIKEHARNELLADALSAAESADKAKSRFMSSVSHELRTPLNAIIGFIALARDAKDNIEHIQEYLEDTEHSAKQLLGIINNVLDMSAIETGRLKLAHEAFNFRELLNALGSTYSSQCSRKGVRFETKLLSQVDDWLVGDQLRLNQILMNLLSNAVKFTESGSVRLSVRQTEAPNGRVFLRFEITDTGCGMSEDMLGRLWKPFEQESALTGGKYGGSGLGLSIVRSLVMMMDGAVDVRSSPGAGSVFTVELPFTAFSGQDGGNKVLGTDSLRVLVADDSAGDCEYMSLVLGQMGVRHTCVRHADEALIELDTAHDTGDPYNICIIDWKMPDMNGIEITKCIRGRYNRDIVIIIMSALEQYQADEQARNAGADAFVTKPLFQSTLFDLLMSLTGGKLTKPQQKTLDYRFDGKRLLLAEDNRLNRVVTVGLLKKSGIKCETADDGSQAVTMFRGSDRGYYDAILMDLRMPVMDGLEATRAIRASDHPDAKTVPIIALSAQAFSEDIAKSLQSGMYAHVTKPVDMDVLLETLGRLFREE